MYGVENMRGYYSDCKLYPSLSGKILAKRAKLLSPGVPVRALISMLAHVLIRVYLESSASSSWFLLLDSA